MTTINIGIVAHVDAGKTSLTERILYETHVIEEVGRVDSGTTQTDSLELEKRRGITIKASVVSFFVGDLKVNLIDTPGHPDFLAEVERAFSVLDGAILLISAVEGIQPQTSVLFSALRRLRIPTIIFINKIDRNGAQSDGLIQRIREKLTEQIIPFQSVEHIGTKQASVLPSAMSDQAFRRACIERLALGDDRLLTPFLEGQPIADEQIHISLTRQVQEAALLPVYFGSAMTGVGVGELLADLGRYFPSTRRQKDAPLSGVVFKLEKAPMGEKVAYVRVFAGCLYARADVKLHRQTRDGAYETYTGRARKLSLFWNGGVRPAQTVEAGEFCKVWGLREAKIGDIIGEQSAQMKSLHFATPQFETRIEALRHEDRRRLYQALLELAEEDPLIHVLKDDLHQTLHLRIFGEVQKEVIESMLQERYGLGVRFSESVIVCVEKPHGVGEAIDFMGAPGNPFKATVGFRVEPGPVGSGVRYTYTPGALPLHFHQAIEDATRATLAQGVYGWEVTDILVTLTRTGYNSHRDDGTKRADFHYLVPLVLMEALARAGTDVYEPINRFELRIPAHALSVVLFRLTALGGAYEQPILQNETFVVSGALSVAAAEALRRELPAMTEGEGVLMVEEAGYRKVAGSPPTRKRTDDNPLHREDYLLHVQRVR